MQFPSLEQAERYLTEGEERNPGPWVSHSRYVAQAAKAIAGRHPRLDPELAYTDGLLHDIGRRYGRHGMRHVLDGYRYMMSEGYSGVARVCLTHSYPVKGLAIGADHWDGTAEDFQFVKDTLAGLEYDDYDHLIQLCDCLALPDGFCLMEKRLVDVVMRYGFNEYTLPRWKGYFAIKEEIEQAIGSPVYHWLPGIVENTFR